MNGTLKKVIVAVSLFLPFATCFSQNISNKGKEFWVGYGHHQFMETGGNEMNMVLYLSAEDQPATVTVTIDSSGNPLLPPGSPGGPWQKTYNLLPYQVVSTVNLPKGNFPDAIPSGTDINYDARLWTVPPPAGTGGAGVFRKKGIHIQSNTPIVAYAHIWGSAASGATMLMPVTAWGYSYISLNSKQEYASNCYNWMYVIASKDNTVIEVTPSVKTRAQDKTGLAPGVTKQVTLMKGQIYQLIGANTAADANGNGGTASTGLDLSGTTVKSVASATGECYPIAVFAGSSRTTNPASCGSGGGDNDNQQLFPQHAWGKKYLTVPFSGSSTPSSFATCTFKVAVGDPTTVVKRNGTTLTGLIGGKYYSFESSTADFIEADKPIMVSQYMTGGGCLGTGSYGDPEMVVVAPIEQAIKEVGFYRNIRESIQVNYVTLIVPTAGVASLRIDNSGVFDYTAPHPRNALTGKNYTVVIKRWDPSSAAQCIISCDSAFNAMTYGLGSVESYGYSAGAHINNLNSLTNLHNTPDTSNGGNAVHQYTGVSTPVNISILVRYQPLKLTWKFSELLPSACWSSSPAFTGDFVMDPASLYLVDSPIIDGVKYYRYTLPQTFTFNCSGMFDIPVDAYSPGIDNCGSKETLYTSVEVKDKPIIDWNYQHPTQCTKDTVYLQGPTAGLSGLTPLSLSQWKWLLPGGIISSHMDTAIVLPPGTYDIKLVAVSQQGLLSDTVTKTITIYDPPVTVLTAVPDVVCLGQSITFNQTATYGAAGVPINNYYWDFGDGNTANGLVTTQVHNYGAYNTYIAKAAVRVSALCVGDTVQKIVIVSPEAQIDFTYPTGCLPGTGLAQFNASLNDLGGTPITSYSWNFGDPASGANNTSIAQNPTHTYSTYGTYPVTLTITNNTGCNGDTTINLTFGLQPVLNYPPLPPVCVSGAAFSVGTATVTNSVSGTGSYSGPGITNTTTGAFNPAVAGAGTHTITYSYVTPTCTETITQNITVNPLPVVNGGTYPPVCANAAPLTLNGVPAGGTFNGPGVAGTTFTPATAGAGTHNIVYTYTDVNGCGNSSTVSITVNALPVVNAGTYSPVCVNAVPITLNGTPAGGAFTGPGVSGNTFTPATAGTGSHTITYSYNAANGCAASTTTTITVNALPVVNTGTYSPVCINAATITLNGTPAGGTFSGPGVTGTSFNPSTAGAGTHFINYIYTDANNCAASASTSIIVNALPVVDAGAYTPVCISSAPITLNGTPAGGTFSGAGVTGTTFTPAIAGAGTHNITYTYTDVNGCGNSSTVAITVFALPVVNAGTYSPVCINTGSVTLNPTPAGGTFTGPGITGTSFVPATAGPGTHNITYTYTDVNGCVNTGGTSITVNALPVVNGGNYAPVCINAAPLTLNGTPAGGVFGGPGVAGTSFNPATAGAGTHNLTYTYTDANGCSNTSAAIPITVNALPVVTAGTYSPVCISVASVPLNGTPAGGAFSGPGITGTNFIPATAGAGTHNIIYTYTAANGCGNSSTASITVNALPVVNAGTYSQVCIDAAPFALNGTPAGGIFSGPGITGSTFNPSTAGAGTHNITYTFTDPNGCSNSNTTSITVNLVPVLNAGTYPPVCLNATPVTLNGTPVGGTFSGPGVTGNTFNPLTAGVGTHNITYGNVAGCNNTTASATITVNAVPGQPVATSPLNYCQGGTATSLTATADPGNTLTWYNNPGLTGGTATAPIPSTAAAGTANYFVTQTTAAGCISSSSMITVNVLPALANNTIAVDQTICSGSPSALLTAGIPTGGTGTYAYQWQQSIDGGTTWSNIPGATASTFDAGTPTVTTVYRRTITSGLCSNTSNAVTITVVTAITNINVNSSQTICEGTAPVLLDGQTPTGGSGAFTYQWESSPNGSTWSAIAGANGEDYQPPSLTATTYYRRKITSGPCSATSSAVQVTVTAKPMAAISGPAAICEYNNASVSFTATAGVAPFSIQISVAGPGGTVNLTQSIPNNGPASINVIPVNSLPGSYTISLLSITDNNSCVRNTGFANINITVNPRPTVNAGTYAPLCVSAAPLMLNGTPAGGTFTGTGITANTFNPATAGAGPHSFVYTYTDASGCSNTSASSVTVNALPVVNAGTYSPLCINATSITLNGTPAGGTFSGPGVTGNTFNPATAGAGVKNISYTYTDANGCSNTAPVSITVNALPVVNAGTYSPLCINAASITLNGTPAGGTFTGPGITGNTFNAAAAGAGTHSIVYAYTDANGCSNAATNSSITVNALPVVNAGTYPPICVGASAMALNGTPAGGTFSGVGVSGNTFNPTTAGAGMHNINYTYTDANGCSNTAAPVAVEVDPRPQASFAASNDICLSQSLTINPTASISSGSIVAWNWDLGDGYTPSYANGNSFTVNYTSAQGYNVQLIAVSDKGCVSAPSNQTINVHPLPVADFAVPTKICLPGGVASFVNQSSVAEANPSLTYTWNFGDGTGTSTLANPSYVYAGAGAYNVTLMATSAFGCQTISAPKVVNDFYDKPNALFFVAPAEICQGENIVFDNQSSDPNGSTIQSWTWAFSDGTAANGQVPVKKFTIPGDYTITLTVTNAAGCKSDPYPQPVKVHLQPVIDAGRSFVVPQGTTIQFEATANSSSFTFDWSPPTSLTDPGSLRPTLIASADQTYTLTATGDYGCYAQDYITVKILKPVKVPNVFTPNGDGIHDKWAIPNLADYPGCTVQVFNRYGQQVFYSSGYGTPWDGTYKGSDMPVGTYYYVIQLENGFKPMSGSVTIIR